MRMPTDGGCRVGRPGQREIPFFHQPPVLCRAGFIQRLCGHIPHSSLMSSDLAISVSLSLKSLQFSLAYFTTGTSFCFSQGISSQPEF